MFNLSFTLANHNIFGLILVFLGLNEGIENHNVSLYTKILDTELPDFNDN